MDNYFEILKKINELNQTYINEKFFCENEELTIVRICQNEENAEKIIRIVIQTIGIAKKEFINFKNIDKVDDDSILFIEI